MLRWLNQLVVSVALLAVTTLALAGEAGRLVFAAGSVHVAGQPASTSHTVMEGDTIVTGANGHAHLKTIDNGYLIVRPGSHARVVAYHVDSQNPANTRIKIELVQGVARSISGQAVQQSKENFRFNRPFWVCRPLVARFRSCSAGCLFGKQSGTAHRNAVAAGICGC